PDIQAPPAFGVTGDAEGASTDALKDIEIATQVADAVDRSGEPTPIMLLSSLTFEPVTGTSLVEVSYADGSPRLAARIVRLYVSRLAAKRNRADRAQVDERITFLQDLVDSESGPARAEAQQKLGQAKVAALSLPLTRVDPAPAVVSSSGPPLSRQVMAALGLLLGLAIGVGAAFLVETAFPRVVAPSDAEEASELPLIATVRKNGVRRTPMPVIDRPFSPAAEDSQMRRDLEPAGRCGPDRQGGSPLCP
ncbi:MAG: hypothetical protein ACJ75M_22335, partial [Actinomycetes bacterium]